MKLGDAASVTRTYATADVAEYVALGGATPAPGEAPEALIGALFSYLLGVKLPGPGTNYLKQNTDYLAPARLGVPLTATVCVARMRPEKHLVDLDTVCTDADGVMVARGRALVYVKDVADAFS